MKKGFPGDSGRKIIDTPSSWKKIPQSRMIVNFYFSSIRISSVTAITVEGWIIKPKKKLKVQLIFKC